MAEKLLKIKVQLKSKHQQSLSEDPKRDKGASIYDVRTGGGLAQKKM